MGIDILGTLVVAFAALIGLYTGRDWYLSIALAWALVSFIGAIALAKYLEGRAFDE
jgi:multicomponent Na+:H+ antiporter subunit F